MTINRIALITGGSRGIGAAIARKFALEGYQVIIHYAQSKEAAEAVASQCQEHGVQALTMQADLRSKAQIIRMKEQLAQLDMLPDILVNNAGIAHYGMLADVTEEDWDQVMNVNLKGLFLMTQSFMDSMVNARFGRIINVSSIWGLTGASCEVLYSTAKGGVNAFTKALAKELAPSGVTVNAVAPGAVDTSMLQHLQADELASLQEAIPAGRLASPEEIAALVYFLTLPESGYLTGQIISPNGGWLT